MMTSALNLSFGSASELRGGDELRGPGGLVIMGAELVTEIVAALDGFNELINLIFR